MLQVEISASIRKTSGKGPMRQLRMAGMTPAVVYGGRGGEAQKLQLDTKSLTAQLLKLRRRNAVVKLNIDGEFEKDVVIGEIQTDPVMASLIHVDFCEIDLQRERPFTVAVVYRGTAKGVDLGGVMNTIHSEVVIEGKPLDIPDECIIDITEMEIGDDIKCGAIVIPDNVRMLTDPQAMAVTILKPGAQEVEEGEEEEIDGEMGGDRETE